MPSQHVSFRGTRTTLAFQDAIACTDAESDGPSNMPQPCAQAYSVPERFTPRSRMGRPAESTSRVNRSGTEYARSEEHTSELQSLRHLVCRLLLEKKRAMLLEL